MTNNDVKIVLDKKKVGRIDLCVCVSSEFGLDVFVELL